MMTLLPGIDRDPVEIPSLAKQESSVRHLQLLYTIVAGLALSDAIGALFGEQAADDASAWQLLPLLIAFVVTLIPFFHAALRHLDDAYLIDPTAHQVKRGALAADFLFLFFEGCLLFALAHRLEAERVFLGLFSVLLVVDIVGPSPFIWRLPRLAGKRRNCSSCFSLASRTWSFNSSGPPTTSSSC